MVIASATIAASDAAAIAEFDWFELEKFMILACLLFFSSSLLSNSDELASSISIYTMLNEYLEDLVVFVGFFQLNSSLSAFLDDIQT